MVYILPLRNENKNEKMALIERINVYILPLRNENNNAINSTKIAVPVYILPLRNENKQNELLKEENKRFISYLWGMKTVHHIIKSRYLIPSLYPTFEEWKHNPNWVPIISPNKVYILPLRNENFWDDWWKRIISNVYILPLRNENQ